MSFVAESKQSDGNRKSGEAATRSPAIVSKVDQFKIGPRDAVMTSSINEGFQNSSEVERALDTARICRDTAHRVGGREASTFRHKNGTQSKEMVTRPLGPLLEPESNQGEVYFLSPTKNRSSKKIHDGPTKIKMPPWKRFVDEILKQRVAEIFQGAEKNKTKWKQNWRPENNSRNSQ
ncbi:hypothetical protein Ancab_023454 [Ancistrocladus abbreviatus]